MHSKTLGGLIQDGGLIPLYPLITIYGSCEFFQHKISFYCYKAFRKCIRVCSMYITVVPLTKISAAIAHFGRS